MRELLTILAMLFCYLCLLLVALGLAAAASAGDAVPLEESPEPRERT